MSKYSRRKFVNIVGATSGGFFAIDALSLAQSIAATQPIVLDQCRADSLAERRLIDTKVKAINSAGAAAQTLRSKADPTFDVSISLSQDAINKFLAAHYKNNPQFYKPSKPVYSITYKGRTMSFRAKVDPSPANIILDPPPSARERFKEWYACKRPRSAFNVPTQLPPNVELSIPHLTLYIDIPTLTSPSTTQTLQVDFEIVIDAMMRLVVDTDGARKLQLTAWSATLTALADPSMPNIGPLPSDCKPLADFLRDTLVIGGNVALQNLTNDLTEKLPLPPIDVVNGVVIYPKDLNVANKRVEITATLGQPMVQDAVSAEVRSQLDALDLALSRRGGLDEVVRNVARKVYERDTVLHENAIKEELASVPEIRAILDRYESLSNSRPPSGFKPGTSVTAATALQSDVAVEISSGVIDALAKHFLTANSHDCSRWYSTPQVPSLPYAQGRGCYTFDVSQASGGISGTTVSMQCAIYAAGYLQAQLCWDDPCGPDACSPVVSIGLGIDGPGKISVTLRTGWFANEALFLQPHIDKVPHLFVIGLPPGLSDIANLLLGVLSDLLIKVFLNAILSVIASIPLIRISHEVPAAKVKVSVDDFAVANDSGRLAVGGRLSFS